MAPSSKTTPKKNASLWALCENCDCSVLSKDTELHQAHCPPDYDDINHCFVKGNALYGMLDVKTQEEIKGVNQHDRENLVFLSQSVIVLCGLHIGTTAVIECNGERFTRVVWPTIEKSLSSILMLKNSFDLTNSKPNTIAKITKLPENVPEARKIYVIILNAPKHLELTPELQNRLHKLHVDRTLSANNKISLSFYGKILKFEVKQIDVFEPECDSSVDDVVKTFSDMSIEETISKITERTKFELYGSHSQYTGEITFEDPFSTIGGTTDEINELRELMNALFNNYMFVNLSNIKPTYSVLLYGHSGTGKTMIANAFAKTLKVNIVQINAPDLYSKSTGNPEQSIKQLFTDAKENAPSLIVLDDVDMLCPSRTGRMTDAEKRIVSSLLIQLDEVNESNEKIFILGTTNKLDTIDAAFRRCGRFEREMEIPIPNPKGRCDILTKILKDITVDADVLKEIGNVTHGFVGADLVALCTRAIQYMNRHCKQNLEMSDFKFALTKVGPSAMREVQIEVPNVKWADIGGQEKLKLILKQSVEWPLKYSESFVRMGITPPRGVLMYGPPGCSKTMIAKALANESGLNFLSIKGPELFSKWVGESEKAVRDVFRKARQVAPSIIFFDEIDALGGERSSSGNSSNVQERVLAQLLTELDGVTPLGDVTVLAATNRPDKIDKALLRPGRLDRIVYVPLPNSVTRRDIFKIKLSKMPTCDVCIEDLVARTENYSGAEVNAVCHEAAMMALEENLQAEIVTFDHFRKALKIITPRTPDSLIKIYEEYRSK